MNAFGQKLGKRFDDVATDAGRFAEVSKLDEGAIRDWVEHGPDSRLTRSYVISISWWLDILAELKGVPVSRNRELRDLLAAAGYTPMGPERERRPILVGYVDVPPLAIAPRGDGDPCGPAIQVTRDIAVQAGWEVVWKRFDTRHSLIRALSEGTVDLACPVLAKLPLRLFYLQYSRPVPGRQFAVEVLVSRRSQHDYISIDEKRLLVTHIDGEIGETLGREILPNAIFENGFPDLAALQNHLTRNKPPAGFYRCVVASETACRQLQQACPNSFTRLALERPPMRFSLAFATPLHDKGLIPILDQCIGVLDSEGQLNLSWAQAGVPPTPAALTSAAGDLGRGLPPM